MGKFNCVIIYDNRANVVGDFLDKLAKSTNKALADLANQSNNNLFACMLDSSKVDENSLQLFTYQFQGNPFIAFLYGHGLCDSFFMENVPIISIGVNDSCFPKAFIITLSCLNGNILADCLLNNNTKTFIGYIAPVIVPIDHNGNCTDMIEIYTKAIEVFFNGGNAYDVYSSIWHGYDNLVMDSSKNPFHRLYFMKNRDALNIKGDTEIKLTDMLV